MSQKLKKPDQAWSVRLAYDLTSYWLVLTSKGWELTAPEMT